MPWHENIQHEEIQIRDIFFSIIASRVRSTYQIICQPAIILSLSDVNI